MKIIITKLNFLTFFSVIFIAPSFIFSRNFSAIDKISSVIIMITLIVFFISDIRKKHFFKKNVFFKFLSVLLVVFNLSFFASIKLFWFFAFFEASLIPIFVMISSWGYQLERIQARYYLLIYTILFSLPFFFILFKLAITSKLSILFLKKINLSIISTFILFFLFLVKSPIYFFHLWLPKAHVESPIIGSIILAGVLLKLGGYGLFRIRFLIKIINWKLFLLCLIGRRLAVIRCFFQSDQKSLIAYARVAHITFIILTIFLLRIFSLKIFLFLILIHAVCSSLLFLFSFLNFEETNNRLLILNQGISYKSSLILFLMIILIITNFRAPPIPTFFIELKIFYSLLLKRFLFTTFLVLIIFIRCYYRIFLLINSNHGKTFNTILKPINLNRIVIFLIFRIFIIFSTIALILIICFKRFINH